MIFLRYVGFRIVFFFLFYAALDSFHPGISMLSLAIGYVISDAFIFVYKVRQKLKEKK